MPRTEETKKKMKEAAIQRELDKDLKTADFDAKMKEYFQK